MINLKRVQNDDMPLEDSYEREQYPYGTSLSIEGESADQIGFQSLEVGEKVRIVGYAFVSSKRQESEEGNGSGSKCVEFQFTEVDVVSESQKKDRAEKLYGG